jgi:hypothetical protein
MIWYTYMLLAVNVLVARNLVSFHSVLSHFQLLSLVKPTDAFVVTPTPTCFLTSTTIISTAFHTTATDGSTATLQSTVSSVAYLFVLYGADGTTFTSNYPMCLEETEV